MRSNEQLYDAMGAKIKGSLNRRMYVLELSLTLGAVAGVLMVPALREWMCIADEGYRAIEKGGHEILPKSDRNYESSSYRRICYAFFKLMCATPLGKICASDHAMNAVDEMSPLNRDLKQFFEEVGAPYET